MEKFSIYAQKCVYQAQTEISIPFYSELKNENPPMVNYDMKISKVSEMDVRKFTKIFKF